MTPDEPQGLVADHGLTTRRSPVGEPFKLGRQVMVKIAADALAAAIA